MTKHVNLNVHQGTSFSHTIESGLDLTGAALYGHFRKSYYNQTHTEMNLIVAGDPTLGQIQLLIPPASTSGVRPGLYLYDVIVDISGTITKVQEGVICLMPTMTQPA